MVLPGGLLRFDVPLIMGVLNVTPDSFSDGGRFDTCAQAVDAALELVADGATIIDIGGESTRPGSLSISVQEELDRVMPVIEELSSQGEALGALLSIDTSKAAVAKAALGCGAALVNDVTALGDPDMAAVVAQADAGLILMHMRGEPKTMQQGVIEYDDVLDEVGIFLSQATERAVASGVLLEKIMVDPGIGFGKTIQHNLLLTRDLSRLRSLGCPIVYGPSRKRFLGELTGKPPAERDEATAAVCMAAVLAGADVLRVHNPRAVRDAIRVGAALRELPRTDA